MGSEQKERGVAVVLRYPRLGLVRATAWALLGNAVRIETGSVALAQNAVVDGLFSVAGQPRGHFHRFRAVVAGSTAGETTLFLDDCPAEARQALEDALESADDRPAVAASLEGNPLLCNPFSDNPHAG